MGNWREAQAGNQYWSSVLSIITEIDNPTWCFPLHKFQTWECFRCQFLIEKVTTVPRCHFNRSAIYNASENLQFWFLSNFLCLLFPSSATLTRALFPANQVLQGCLLHVRSLCEAASGGVDGNYHSTAQIVLVQLDNTQTMQLHDFVAVQQACCEAGLQRLMALRQTIVQIVWDTVSVSRVWTEVGYGLCNCRPSEQRVFMGPHPAQIIFLSGFRPLFFQWISRCTNIFLKNVHDKNQKIEAVESLTLWAFERGPIAIHIGGGGNGCRLVTLSRSNHSTSDVNETPTWIPVVPIIWNKNDKFTRTSTGSFSHNLSQRKDQCRLDASSKNREILSNFVISDSDSSFSSWRNWKESGRASVNKTFQPANLDPQLNPTHRSTNVSSTNVHSFDINLREKSKILSPRIRRFISKNLL